MWPRRPVARAVIGVIAVNVVWAVDSFICSPWTRSPPRSPGQVVIAAQAAGVLGLAALQAAGLRRA